MTAPPDGDPTGPPVRPPLPGHPLQPDDPHRLDRYELLRVLGQGGMGRVYLGRAPTGRHVAVKVIHPSYASDAQYRRRFRAEVALAAQVPPACTAQVLASDIDHQPAYIVTEYIDAPTLDEVVRTRGALSPANLRGVAVSVAVALDAIHAAGVIHRDLTPRNVLLPHGSAKVIDFGIARPVDHSFDLTHAGNVVGTIRYMSPEQLAPVDGHDITCATDIFAWGLIITFAGIGRFPFGADASLVVAKRTLHDPPDLTGLDEPLQGLVRQALSKDPSHRPSAMGLLAALLRAGRADSPHPDHAGPAPPAPIPGRSKVAVPAQSGFTTAAAMPTPTRSFTGRSAELAELDALVTPVDHDDAASIMHICGPGGIGKTWLAARWAAQHTADFPDGQLYVNLRGFEPAQPPATTTQALRALLKLLHVTPEQIPDDADVQAALYRNQTADKRLLVILDNARDSAQVIPLLPAGATCRVLITSRNQLTDLIVDHDARILLLGGLTDIHAHQVLRHRLGADRVAAEPDAAAALIHHCGGLPLALTIIAARAAANRNLSLTALADELHHAAHRLDGLDGGGLQTDLRATIDVSYQALPADVGTVFNLLSLAPATDIGLAAAASLTGLPTAHARAHLRHLCTASLLHEYHPDQFRMHTLVRLYALERVHADQQPPTRQAALRRLIDFYLHTAYQGDRLLYPHRPPITLSPPEPGCTPTPLPDRAAAMAWFDANHADLLAVHRLAVAQQWDTRIWQLAWAMTIFQWRRGQIHDHRTVWQAALAAADRLNDPAAQAEAHQLVGHAYGQASQYDTALQHLTTALSLNEQLGDTFGQALTHHLLAWIHDELTNTHAALVHADTALHLATTLNNPIWQAVALEALGWYHARLGAFDTAHTYCEKALQLHHDHHHPEGEARTLKTLGYIAHHTGHNTQAQHFYQNALNICQRLGDNLSLATIMDRLGDTYHDSNQPEQARQAWQQALHLYQTQRRTTPANAITSKLGGHVDPAQPPGTVDTGRIRGHRSSQRPV